MEQPFVPSTSREIVRCDVKYELILLNHIYQQTCLQVHQKLNACDVKHPMPRNTLHVATFNSKKFYSSLNVQSKLKYRKSKLI